MKALLVSMPEAAKTNVYEMVKMVTLPPHIVADGRLVHVNDPRRLVGGSEAAMDSGDPSERVAS